MSPEEYIEHLKNAVVGFHNQQIPYEYSIGTHRLLQAVQEGGLTGLKLNTPVFPRSEHFKATAKIENLKSWLMKVTADHINLSLQVPAFIESAQPGVNEILDIYLSANEFRKNKTIPFSQEPINVTLEDGFYKITMETKVGGPQGSLETNAENCHSKILQLAHRSICNWLWRNILE